jgi:hypothetical protein
LPLADRLVRYSRIRFQRRGKKVKREEKEILRDKNDR